jgi:hypothetical protein
MQRVENAMKSGRSTAGRRLVLAILACGLGGGALAAATDGTAIEQARAVLDRWVETRKVISQEKRDYALARELLIDRVRMVARDIEQIKQKTTETEKGIADSEAKKKELQAEGETLRAGATAIDAALATLEARVKALLPRLPDPVRERVKPLSQEIPDDPATTKLSRSRRLQSVVGILNEVNKFHREVTMTSEIRTLRDGSSAEVTALYAGISQGWYASKDGKAAGVGSAGPDGWRWTAADDAAPEILRAIAIAKNDKVAAFARLPIKVD